MNDTFQSLLIERQAALLRLKASVTSLSVQTLRLRGVVDGNVDVFELLAEAAKAANRSIDNCGAQIETISQQFQSEVDDALGL